MMSETIITDGLLRKLPAHRFAATRNLIEVTYNEDWFQDGIVKLYGLTRDESLTVFVKWKKEVRNHIWFHAMK